MIATVDRKAEGSPPATPACADAGTYPRRQRAGRDSPRAWTHTAETRAGGLPEPARTALDGSTPALFRTCSGERVPARLGRMRQKPVQAAFPSLHAQRWTDQLRRCFGRARESG